MFRFKVYLFLTGVTIFTVGGWGYLHLGCHGNSVSIKTVKSKFIYFPVNMCNLDTSTVLLLFDYAPWPKWPNSRLCAASLYLRRTKKKERLFVV